MYGNVWQGRACVRILYGGSAVLAGWPGFAVWASVRLFGMLFILHYTLASGVVVRAAALKAYCASVAEVGDARVFSLEASGACVAEVHYFGLCSWYSELMNLCSFTERLEAEVTLSLVTVVLEVESWLAFFSAFLAHVNSIHQRYWGCAW